MLLAVAALGALAVSVGLAQSAFPGTNGKIAFESDDDGDGYGEISSFHSPVLRNPANGREQQ